MHAAGIVYLVGQVLLGENMSHCVAPPVRDSVTDMPIEIAIDQGDRVEKVRSTTLSNELMPVRRVPAVAGHWNAKFLADVAGEQLGATVENGLAEQCADAMPCFIAVRHAIFGPHV